MPNILSVPGINNQSSQRQSTINNKFSRIDNNPSLRNTQYYNPVLPIHESNYNPQFSKSPLTSIQMSRKGHSKVNSSLRAQQIRNDDTHYHIFKSQNNYKFDWKKILCWVLTALAVIGLMIGFGFLISSLVGKKGSDGSETVQIDENEQYRSERNSGNRFSTGINPILVSPIPYNSIYGPSVSTSLPVYMDQAPSNSIGNPSATTYPTSRQFPSIPVTESSQATSYPSQGSHSSLAVSSMQPTVNWAADPSSNSVPLLDYYPLENP